MVRQDHKTDGHATTQTGPLQRRVVTRRGALALGAAGASLVAAGPAGVAYALGRSRQPAQALHGTLSVMWYSYAPQATIKVPQMMYRRYETLHPGVTLTFPKEPGGDVGTQMAWMTTRAMASRLPDLYGPGSAQQVNSTTSRGWWVDLTPYLDQPNPYVPGNKRWRDMFLPGFLRQGASFDGRNFMVSGDGCNAVFYVNKSIFQRAGAKIPTSWAELLDSSAKIRKAGYYAFSCSNKDGWQIGLIAGTLQDQLWSKEFKQPGSSYFMSTLDFVRAVKTGKLTMTDPRTAEAWQLLKQWMPTWYPGTLTQADFRPFVNGKVAMWYDGTWNSAVFEKALKSQVQIIPFPPVTAASSRYAVGDPAGGNNAFPCGNPLAMPIATQRAGKLALALDFLHWYTQPDVVGPMARERGLIPMIKGAHAGDELAQESVRSYITRLSLTQAVPMPLEWGTKYETLANGYLSGALDLKTALSQLQAVLERDVDVVIAQGHLHV